MQWKWWRAVAGLTLSIAATLNSCKQARYGVSRPVTSGADTPTAQNAEPTPPPPPANNQIDNTPAGVTFGTTGVFHLGDAIFNGSSCQPKLLALPTSGSRLNFTFQVLSDNTPIKISVTDLCGVDLDNNIITLSSNNQHIQNPIAIPVEAVSVPLPPITLSAGVYTLTITSGKNVNNPKFILGNSDDLIVGHVQVEGPNIKGLSFEALP